MDKENTHNVETNQPVASNQNYRQAVQWWEEKRRLYNLLLIGLEIALLLFYWEAVLNFGVLSAIFWTVAYTIAANSFYCLGWGMEILGM